MLAGYKLVRAAKAPDYSDNSDDVEGYLDIFRKVVGEDMIHARSVTAYIEEKYHRHQAKIRPQACQGDQPLPGMEG